MNSEVSVPRDVLEKVLDFIPVGSEVVEGTIKNLLYPNPVTIQDFLGAGRGDEIKPGMWVESESGNLGVLPIGWQHLIKSNITTAIDIESPSDPWKFHAETTKPRFDLQPAFHEDGSPFSVETPERSETLTTVDDYGTAPAGTIIESSGCGTWKKSAVGFWFSPGNKMENHEMASRYTGTNVVRWGK